MSNEKILDKISNLMKRAREADDAEGEASILLAQKLMVKHNVSLSDVELFESKSEVNASSVQFGRLLWWQRILAANLADQFRCRSVLSGTNKVVFYGLNDDAQIASEVYEGAIMHIKYRRSKMSYATKSEKNSYIKGFIYGLINRLEEQRMSMVAETTELMVLVPQEVNDHVDDLTNGRQASIAYPDDLDVEHYLKGMADGVRAEIMTSKIIS